MQMPMLRAMKPLRYMSRMLQVGDEFEPMSGDVNWLTARGRAELVSDAPKRGRPPKAKEPEPEPEVQEPELTNAELREMAEARGLDLPIGYVRNDVLIEMIAEAEKAEGV